MRPPRLPVTSFPEAEDEPAPPPSAQLAIAPPAEAPILPKSESVRPPPPSMHQPPPESRSSLEPRSRSRPSVFPPPKAFTPLVPQVQPTQNVPPASSSSPHVTISAKQAEAAQVEARKGAGLSFAELWPETDRALVHNVEAALASGRHAEAIELCDALLARILASAASLFGTSDAPRDPATLPLLLGLDGRRYLGFRSIGARVARRRKTLGVRRALRLRVRPRSAHDEKLDPLKPQRSVLQASRAKGLRPLHPTRASALDPQGAVPLDPSVCVARRATQSTGLG